MKKILSVFTLMILLYLNASCQEVFNLTINFTSNSFEISEIEKTKLHSIAKGEEIASISLVGHTDGKGSKAFNQELSKNRVESVFSYLLQSGISGIAISMSYYGEEKPLQSNESEEGRLINRRVEVTVTYRKQEIELIEEPLVQEDTIILIRKNEVISISNTELYERLGLGNKTQKFKISRTKDASITTSSGLIFHFKKESFDTDCAEDIDIHITEYISKSSIVKGNMQTTSDGKVLFSRGMYELEAFCNDNPVDLKGGENYTALIPQLSSEVEAKNLKCFYGKLDSLTENVNWTSNSDENVAAITGVFLDPQGIPLSDRPLTKRDKKLIAKKKSEIQGKYEDVDFKELGTSINQSIRYYVFQPNGIGLVNYDEFMKMSREKLVTLRVKIGETIQDNTDVKLVFKKRRSMISPTSVTNDYFEFKGIPKDENVFIVGLKLVDSSNEGLKLGIEQVKIKAVTIDLKLDAVNSMAEVDDRLKSIN